MLGTVIQSLYLIEEKNYMGYFEMLLVQPSCLLTDKYLKKVLGAQEQLDLFLIGEAGLKIGL